ncbi:MAG: alpha-mannosidase, partial [Clostridia bacterium]|nr:alpha-mannosidase [Clostridia bacterium]
MQNQETYVTRTLYKIRDCNRIYGERIFRRIGEIREAEGFETAEHFHTVPEGPFGPMTAGSSWGGSGVSLWLRFSVTVPEEAAGQRLYLDPGTGAYETLCFVDGKPAGLLNSKNSYVTGRHSCLFLTENARPGDRYDIALECYAGHFVPGDSPYSSYGVDRDTEDHRHVFSGIALLVQDETVRDFYFDIQTVLQMALLLPEDNFQRKTARECLLRAFPDLIQYPADGYSDEEIRVSLEKARAHLRPALEKGHPELSRGSVCLVGTSHIDTAWLWPMKETVRKCARTFAEVLSLMRRYPEYSFAQSSALHTEWMRLYYPDVFREMKERIAEGRYELVGGVWVESDCSLPSGEFLIRQFLYGQRYTETWFGKTSSVFWLPDTFGYSGALPQIMKKSGIRTFYTTKMAWNDLNRWPLGTFLWKGIDGSAVPVHTNEDNRFPDVKSVTEVMASVPDKSVSDAVLLGFGFGDGGGGPSEAMLESVKRLTGGVRGLPEIRLSSVESFSKSLEAKADELPVYEGELYLEYHRGTLTTMSETKRNNRKAELSVLDMEKLNVLSGKPKLEDSEEIVKLLLQNQFHDILPGTGIREVNETCRKEVSQVLSRAKEHAQHLAESLNEPTDDLTLRNQSPVPVKKDSVVTLEGAVSPEGYVSQSYTDPMGRTMTDLFGMEIPSLGALVLSVGPKPDGAVSPFTETGNTLDTPFYKAVFDDDGYISSLVDKRTGREICEDEARPLGAFYFGEDLPVDYDAWEIEWDSELKQKMLRGALVSRQLVSDGPVEHRIQSQYRLSGTSLLTVDTVFYSQNPRIDFHVKADWHERHRLLKAGFCVSV